MGLVFSGSLSAATYTVEIHGNFFSPSQLTIAQGDTVTWVWMASGHSTTRTAQPESWDSGVQSVGHQFSRVFQTVGQFQYVCIPHSPHMNGTITVEAPPKTDTTTTLASSKNPSRVGEEVTFTATVVGAGGTPTGTVTFFDGLSAICTNVTLSGGSALCVKSNLVEGDHSITATYSGDSTFSDSTSAALVQKVTSLPDIPSGFSATAVSASEVMVMWNAAEGATGYEVMRSSGNGVYDALPMTGATSLNDGGRSANTSYLYKVRAIGTSGSSDFTAPDPATTTIFTDPVLAGAVINAIHVTELRTAVNAMRVLAGLGTTTFADDPLTAGTVVNAEHITALRTALDAARNQIPLTPLSYTDTTLSAGVTPVRAIHLLELRVGTQ